MSSSFLQLILLGCIGAQGQLHVSVSEFMPLWNDSNVVNHETQMNNIYDLQTPHCPGDSSFINAHGAAPAHFCFSGINGQFDLSRVIGSEWWFKWNDEELKRWVTASSSGGLPYDDAYDEALRDKVSKEGFGLKFDQFALERIMLTRGRAIQKECRKHGCNVRPDVVMVPSLLAHMQHFLWRDHLAWNLVLPMDCIKTTPDQTLPRHCAEGYGAINTHRRYWNMVRKLHYSPYCRSKMNGDCHSAPLIVVHHSFVWDQPTFLAILSALFEQPKGFVDRVVVASIESNFKPVWDSEEKYPLSSRIQPSCSIYNFPSNIKETRQSGTPFFMTLPYPTALSVTASVNFAPPLDSETPQVAPFFDPNIEEYNPHLRRPITILLDANLDRKGGGGKIMQCWIRSLLHSKLVGGGGTCEGSVCSLCHESEASTSISCKDRWPLNTQAKFWELMVASTFCMEPAGDTMTRSHFYAAVLSGCIPVIFDGGVDDFHEDDTTCWAWRGNGLGSTLKYSDFAVIYNATAVRDGSVDVVKELSEMPVKFPSKLLSLRRELDRAAAAMRYSASSSEESPDAFDTFINFLQAIKGNL